MFGRVIAIDAQAGTATVRADDTDYDLPVEPVDVAKFGRLSPGARVAFDTVITMSGPRATRLRRVDGGK